MARPIDDEARDASGVPPVWGVRLRAVEVDDASVLGTGRARTGIGRGSAVDAIGIGEPGPWYEEVSRERLRLREAFRLHCSAAGFMYRICQPPCSTSNDCFGVASQYELMRPRRPSRSGDCGTDPTANSASDEAVLRRTRSRTSALPNESQVAPVDPWRLRMPRIVPEVERRGMGAIATCVLRLSGVADPDMAGGDMAPRSRAGKADAYDCIR